MNEFEEIRDQMLGRTYHRIVTVDSLPSPTFHMEGRQVVSFSTNNYLGLATSERLIDAARRGLERYGVGNCESRLLGGNLEIYEHLEAKLAALKQKESAVLFATGFLTNMGVLTALVSLSKIARIYGYRPRQHYKYVYFSDEFNHISIREGIRMSGASRVSYRHCDMANLEEKLRACGADMKIIVSDGVFSQDGDILPLPDMLQLADKYDALVYIDDAHATGILGDHGGGTTDYFNLNSPRLICMGTLSKAYGAIGGFVATEKYLADMLRYACSAYGFTSTLPPDQAMAVSEAMDAVVDEPWRRDRLWENQRRLLAGFDGLGCQVTCRDTCILPVLVGDEAMCERHAAKLGECGFHVDSVVFPAVPRGAARLRFMANTNHTPEQIQAFIDAMGQLRGAGRNRCQQA